MRRARRAIALTAIAISVGTAAASAAGGPVYAGGSPKANRYMDIEIHVLAGGRRANWRIDVYGPCTEHERLGRTVGTDAGGTPPDPQLRLTGGRFALSRHGHNFLNTNFTWSYQLAGHTVPGGFAGTFHYHESQPPAYRCDSHVLQWRAHRRPGGFP